MGVPGGGKPRVGVALVAWVPAARGLLAREIELSEDTLGTEQASGRRVTWGHSRRPLGSQVPLQGQALPFTREAESRLPQGQARPRLPPQVAGQCILSRLVLAKPSLLPVSLFRGRRPAPVGPDPTPTRRPCVTGCGHRRRPALPSGHAERTALVAVGQGPQRPGRHLWGAPFTSKVLRPQGFVVWGSRADVLGPPSWLSPPFASF